MKKMLWVWVCVPLLFLGCESSSDSGEQVGAPARESGAGSGGESEQETDSDSGLLAKAHEQAGFLCRVFGLSEPDWDTFDIIWGGRSALYHARDWDLVTITTQWAGTPDILQAHIRHEMFHVMSGYFTDGVPEYCNGVRIADYVAWRAKQ